MLVKPCAEFTSDLPDDMIEDDERIIQYPGKNVAEAFAEILARLGCEVDPPVNMDFLGWELDIKAGKRRLWCRIGMIDAYYISFLDTSWWSKLWGDHPVYVDVISRFADELARDPRFHDVLWYRPEQVTTGVGGSKHPVIR